MRTTQAASVFKRIDVKAVSFLLWNGALKEFCKSLYGCRSRSESQPETYPRNMGVYGQDCPVQGKHHHAFRSLDADTGKGS